jgi:hypothetical protein
MFSKKEKIFCIGFNKTGTTTIGKTLSEFGYSIGRQAVAENLLKNFLNKDYKPIIKYCKTATAFQDIPFSLPFMWLILKVNFPDAKFILTYRDAEKWYSSITRFHSKKFADGIRIPNKEDLINADYRYKSFAWEANRATFNTPENDIYNKQLLIKTYNRHNEDVNFYFRNDPNFLAIDVSNKEDYARLCSFLNKAPKREDFPHLKKTAL